MKKGCNDLKAILKKKHVQSLDADLNMQLAKTKRDGQVSL